MSVARGSIRLRDLLAVVLVASFVANILLPAFDAARERRKSRDCRNNLRMLGAYLSMYGCVYRMPQRPPPAAVSGFLATLCNVPTPGVDETNRLFDLGFIDPGETGPSEWDTAVQYTAGPK